MKSIGGYFELECGKTPPYYSDGFYLNSGRNALRYIVRGLGLKQIYAPRYTCSVIFEAFHQENCEIKFYDLDKEFFPNQNIPANEFIIYNNYFGVTGTKVKQMSEIYPNLIVDNAQAFYSPLTERASIYSPRKFFGLPDGGILRGKDIPLININKGTSYNVMSHLLKRIDLGPTEGYEDFRKNAEKISDYPVEKMSELTETLMGNIDYKEAKEKRIANFYYLKSELPTLFPISMDSDDVPLVYPFLVKNGEELRKKLISQKIFCAQYWPDVLSDCNKESMEYNLVKNIVALPIDQRYSISEMSQIISAIKK